MSTGLRMYLLLHNVNCEFIVNSLLHGDTYCGKIHIQLKIEISIHRTECQPMLLVSHGYLKMTSYLEARSCTQTTFTVQLPLPENKAY